MEIFEYLLFFNLIGIFFLIIREYLRKEDQLILNVADKEDKLLVSVQIDFSNGRVAYIYSDEVDVLLK